MTFSATTSISSTRSSTDLAALDIVIPLTKKHRPNGNCGNPPSSLIASLTSAAAANREQVFQQLGLSHGVQLFPNSSTSRQWVPPKKAKGPTYGDFSLPLENFAVNAGQGGVNNTLVLKALVPSNSKRFSFNIAAPDHNEFNSILFHFNPRNASGEEACWY